MIGSPETRIDDWESIQYRTRRRAVVARWFLGRRQIVWSGRLAKWSNGVARAGGADCL